MNLVEIDRIDIQAAQTFLDRNSERQRRIFAGPSPARLQILGLCELKRTEAGRNFERSLQSQAAEESLRAGILRRIGPSGGGASGGSAAGGAQGGSGFQASPHRGLVH